MNVGGNPPIVTTNLCKRQVAQPQLVKKLQADKVENVISSGVAGPDYS